MKPILSVAVLFLSGFVLMGDEPKPDAAKAKATEKALETFAGTWEIVAVQRCVNGTWKDKQWTGKPRPTEFKLPAADVVLELRRVKADR